MELTEIFAINVQKIRLKQGLSQEELANKCQLHRTYISLVERNKRNITLKNIEKIAQGLDVESYVLLQEDYINDTK